MYVARVSVWQQLFSSKRVVTFVALIAAKYAGYAELPFSPVDRPYTRQQDVMQDPARVPLIREQGWPR